MRHFKIIFTVLVLFFGASACMQQEKEVFESATLQARKAANGMENQKGVTSPEMTVNGAPLGNCNAPTNLVFSIITTSSSQANDVLFTWIAPTSNAPLSYTVTLTRTSPLPITTIVSTVTSTSKAFYNLLDGVYDISIVGNCSNLGSTAPLNGTLALPLGGGGTGTTGMSVDDNLDLMTNSSPTVNTYYIGNTTNWYYNYTYHSFAATLANWYTPGCVGVTNLSTGTINSSYPITFSLVSSGVISSYDFTTPNPPSSSNYCGSLIKVTLNPLKGIPLGTKIAWKEVNNTQSTWVSAEIAASGTSNMNIGNLEIGPLKRNTLYRIKFFSVLSPNFTRASALNPCGGVGGGA